MGMYERFLTVTRTLQHQIEELQQETTHKGKACRMQEIKAYLLCQAQIAERLEDRFRAELRAKSKREWVDSKNLG